MADEWRGKMIEAAVEMDDDAMMMYLEGEEPDVPTLRSLLRKGTLEMAFVPVLGGSAFKNKGVQPLLNAVIDYLPSPMDVANTPSASPPKASCPAQRVPRQNHAPANLLDRHCALQTVNLLFLLHVE